MHYLCSDKTKKMNLKKISLLVILLLLADQALKIWVKTHMQLGEAIIIFPDWFQLRFVENNGTSPRAADSTGANCCWEFSASVWPEPSHG